MSKRNIEKEIAELAKYIHVVRDQKVMLDFQLAELYGVEVKALNQAIKRNQERFPEDFAFKLDETEFIELRSQFVTVEQQKLFGRKDQMPTAFTEAGAYALSFCLRSERAVEMGIFIIRAFTNLRKFVFRYESILTELKNSKDIASTFRNFEKMVEQHFVVLYKNNTKLTDEVDLLKQQMKEVSKKLKLDHKT